MSGTDAAATLTLRIDTGQAKADLELLKKEYGDLLAVMRAPATGKGLSGVGESATLAAKQIDTLTKQVATLQAKMATAGASGSSGLLGNVTKAGYEVQGLFGQVDKSVERSNSNMKIMLKSAEMTGNAAVKAVQDIGRAKNQANSLELRVIAAEEAAKASAAAKAVQDLGRAKNLANSLELRVIAAEEAAKASAAAKAVQDLGRAKNLANSLELRVIAAEEAAKASAAAKAVQDLGRAKNLANSLELRVIAAEEAARIKAAAKDAQDLAKWLALTDKQRASATVQASKAYYGGARQEQLPGVAGSSQALSAAQAVGSVVEAEAALARLTTAHKSLAPATKESAASQIHWNKVANEGHAAARGLAGSLGTLWITYGSLVPLLAGATIGSAFINAAKAGSEFAYQLTFVKALGGESAEAVQKLSDAALSLSQTGLRGPTEIASGFRILAQAGLDASEALEAMPQTLNLATVGEMEMEQAAVTLVGVMKAFNLTVKDSERVGDVFAKAAALSQTSVQGMTEAMKTASVVGEQYGANLEDTATAITLLAKVNITGTAAGTSFRNMLKELYAPVPQSAKAMENLGLKTKDAEGNLRNFADVVFDLKGKLADFSKGDQVEILQRLFGERGAKEAVAMLALTKDKWVELRDEIKNSKGFMEGVATELENTAKGKWAQAINTMKVQLVTAFNEMEPIFSQLADNLKALFADPAFLQNLKAIVGGMASLTNAVIEMAPHLITLAQAWVVYKAAMITAAVWTATSTAVMGFATSMQIASGVMGPALGPMASMKAIVAGLPSLLMAIPAPLAVIAGGLAAGAVAWTIWGNNASRAGDKAYDAAVRASAALDKVSRREKYGVGDLGEAQEELDKAEKLLSLRVEGRATGTALSDARESVTKWGKVVEGLEREKYKASNASEGLKAAVAGETKKPTRKASEILGSGGRGGGRSFSDETKDIVRGYGLREQAQNQEFENYKKILDQRVKYGALSQEAENVLLEAAREAIDGKTTALAASEKGQLQALLVSKETDESAKESIRRRIEEIDSVNALTASKREHTVIMREELAELKNAAAERKLAADTQEFVEKEERSRQRAQASFEMMKTHTAESRAAMDAYLSTIDRGESKLREYEKAVRDAREALSQMREEFERLGPLNETQVAALDAQSQAAERASSNYDRLKESIEGQAEANAQSTLALKAQEEGLNRLQSGIQASNAMMSAMLDARTTSGYYTSLESMRAEGNINKERIAQLAQLKASYEAMGEAGVAAAAQVEAEMISLSAHLDPIADKVREIFEGAFTNFFDDMLNVINGTKSLKAALKDLGNTILKDLWGMASKELSQQFMKILGGGLEPGKGAGLFSMISQAFVPDSRKIGNDIVEAGRSLFNRVSGGGASISSNFKGAAAKFNVLGGAPSDVAVTSAPNVIKGLKDSVDSAVISLNGLGTASTTSQAAFSTLNGSIATSQASITTLGTSSAVSEASISAMGATSAMAEASMLGTEASSLLADVALASTAVSATAASAGLSSVAASSSTDAVGGLLGNVFDISTKGLFEIGGLGFHQGGVVGRESTFLRNVPASVFQGAPRFHGGGLAGDEVPAILQRGEGVFTANQMKAMGLQSQAEGFGGTDGKVINITVNINGNNNNPQDVRRAAGQGAREAMALLNSARRYA